MTAKAEAMEYARGRVASAPNDYLRANAVRDLAAADKLSEEWYTAMADAAARRADAHAILRAAARGDRIADLFSDSARAGLIR